MTPNDQSPKVRACVFCGSTPVTAEHVVPQWLQALPEVAATIPKKHDWNKGKILTNMELVEGLAVMTMTERKKVPPASHFVVKAVCSKCNSGWMSRLEIEVAPIIKDLLRGSATTLSPVDLTVLSFWAFKTAGMFQMDQPSSRAITDRLLQEAKATMSPPPGTTVHLFRMTTPEESLHLSHEGGKAAFRGRMAPAEPNLSATFAIFERVGFLVRRIPDPSIGSLLQMPALTRIWPLPTREVVWPPPLEMDKARLGRLKAQISMLSIDLLASRGGI